MANVTEKPEGEPEAAPEEEEGPLNASLAVGGGLPMVGALGRGQAFLGDVREELRKVTWPTRKQVLVETAVVIIVTVFFTSLITGVDWGFALLFNRLLFGR